MQNSRFAGFSLSVIGSSHIRKNIVCQDYSDFFLDKHYAAMAVSDGHGGERYFRSDHGARFAVNAALESIGTFMQCDVGSALLERPNKTLRQLENSVIFNWNNAVSAHLTAHPFLDEELDPLPDSYKDAYKNRVKTEKAYGCTLTAAVLSKDFWFAFRIGDGECVAMDQNGVFSLPVPWDEQCVGNVTTSLCDANAIENFRHYCSRDLPAAVFACSDGVSESFLNKEALFGFYRSILSNIKTFGEQKTVSQLDEYLSTLSAQGSTDDMSVAALWDTACDMAISQAIEMPEEIDVIQTDFTIDI